MGNDARSAVATAKQGQGAVAAPDTGTVADFLKMNEKRIGRALPKHIESDRFLQIVMNEVRKSAMTGRSLTLDTCTMPSLMGAVLLCAQLALMPGPLGHVYLIPRRIKGVPEVQFQLGYKGVIDLAYRSGKIGHIVARPVYEGDFFDYELGLDERLTHRPTFESDRGNPKLYYGVAKFNDGGHNIHIMSPSEIDTFRQRAESQTADEVVGPWRSDPVPMSCKTVILRMKPWLPLSTEAARAFEADDQITHASADGNDLDLVTTRPEDGDGEPVPEEQQAQ